MADEIWANELRRIGELVAIPGMSPSRALRILEHEALPLRFTGGKNLLQRMFAEHLKWPTYRDGTPLFRVVPVNGYNCVTLAHLNQELIVPTVLDRVAPHTQAIMELGCGFGRHLFALRDLLEHKRGDIRYFGGEIAPNGIAAGESLASLEPSRDSLTFHRFDYLNPDFSFLDGISSVLVFTCHSIEQVRSITDRWFVALGERVAQVTCVHHEPIGWQYDATAMQHVRAGTLPKNTASVNLFGPVNALDAAITPYYTGWNLNLAETVADLERRGFLRSEPPVLNIGGNFIYNPTTQLVWTKL